MSTMKIDSYEEIKDRLRVRLMDMRTHEEDLQRTVYEPVGCGFALVVYMELPDEIAEGGIANVPKVAAAALGMDERTLVQDAMENSVENMAPKLSTMRSALFGPPENLFTEDECGEEKDFLVLTNMDGRLGASVLYYPDVTSRISEIVDGDYFVLPSSIHEVLILPDHGQIPAKELLMMVKEVNEAEVLPEEQLGNKVLHFRADLQMLQVAAELTRDRNRGEER